ncbi:MAG TPA: hypothetical protein VFR87_09495 [Nocardioidaceae bacterium]|nr:hypothetical protein [Nocardioidaceae bacterium]
MLKKLLTAGAAVSLLAIGLGPVSAAEEAGNNLSVPAIFVPSVGLAGPTCDATDNTLLPDPATVSTVYPGYWIQGEDVWQADCMTAADNTITAGAEWGDNLTNAPLKAGTPIRTEIGLLADAATYPMTGFGVDKLTPELEDRYATYGTNDGSGIASYPEVRVWNAGATLSIVSSAGLVVYDGPFTAEINSTGRVVYGYNWQKPLTGDYTITFHAPTVLLSTTDAGTLFDSDADGDYDSVKLTVTVGNKGGGGGGGGRPVDPPGGGGGGGGQPDDPPGGGGGGGGPRGPR